MRSAAVAWVTGNVAYFGTGRDFGLLFNDFWEYDTANDNWQQKADFGGTARWLAAGFVLNGKCYIGTGVDSAHFFLNGFWQYDPAGDPMDAEGELCRHSKAVCRRFCITAAWLHLYRTRYQP